MNPHLKLAYDYGVQQAIEDAIKTSDVSENLKKVRESNKAVAEKSPVASKVIELARPHFTVPGTALGGIGGGLIGGGLGVGLANALDLDRDGQGIAGVLGLLLGGGLGGYGGMRAGSAMDAAMAKKIEEFNASDDPIKSKFKYASSDVRVTDDAGLTKNSGFEGLGKAVREGLSPATSSKAVAEKSLSESATRRALENISGRSTARTVDDIPDYLPDGSLNPEGVLGKHLGKMRNESYKKFDTEQKRVMKAYRDYLESAPPINRGPDSEFPAELVRRMVDDQAMRNLGMINDPLKAQRLLELNRLYSQMRYANTADPLSYYRINKALPGVKPEEPRPAWLSNRRPGTPKVL